MPEIKSSDIKKHASKYPSFYLLVLLIYRIKYYQCCTKLSVSVFCLSKKLPSFCIMHFAFLLLFLVHVDINYLYLSAAALGDLEGARARYGVGLSVCCYACRKTETDGSDVSA